MTISKKYDLSEYEARLISNAYVISSRYLYIELYDGRYYEYDMKGMSINELALIQLDCMRFNINTQRIFNLYN